MAKKIKKITGYEILDSRGNPTISIKIEVEGGVSAVAAVPSGASTGTHEALELRDGNPKRYRGQGVLKAIKNVNTSIAKRLVGLDVTRQQVLDQAMIELDGTDNKSRLGANAILGVSLAAARAGAVIKKQPLYSYIRSTYRLVYRGFKLPLPMMNVLNGGRHADWAIDFQECLIIPQQRKFAERVRAGAETFHALKKILKENGYETSVGDEGGYAPHLKSNEQAFDLIMEAIKAAGYRPGKDIKLGADIAASEFYDAKNGRYELKLDRKSLTAEQLTELYAGWIKKYPFMTLEDGLAEDDWDNWTEQTKHLGGKLTLVGDDLFVTDAERLQRGIKQKVANAILIKVNQIGSLSETIDAIELAHANGYVTSISHRSGETIDTFIADLAVAVNSEFIKTGSLSRSERLEKYNRLMEIERELNFR
ncbi:phosphopyruvate hydratase [candidate division WOR-1 bacterium RIFOXYD2_FULL_41_8]|uniref:Enolase n=1 Tax=Candidatus Uhrbacteria bacterium RIFOXYC2_FULL_47_19 TaxID=1802424 RepID=A0A1F7WEC6_9BACT|nr:MAG: phosphopyruvate hydratase [candidate division WOR-1 bacterium RIFOXYD2_FULL_41_8]OGM01143.1 MAG: phosphopyruvate hydratase [Candidatus Uhrbacteria bacterium RIFOXYC2_FULL_47_19]HCC22162.1 phosphopyruvate hydratase [Candidatus Uhrbacteria bacterium]